MPTFHFKQFSLCDDRSIMKIGTDAVLLGAWTNENALTVLDIGTGSGIIAMMLAQKINAKIIAIDIDKNSADQAKENIANCKWHNTIQVHHISFQEFWQTQNEKFDLVVTNPPYFHNSLKSLKNEKNLVKHNDQLSFDELIFGIKKILTTDGKFNIILPFKEGHVFKDKALTEGLYCNNILEIKPTSNKPINRLLMQFLFKKSFNPIVDTLNIREKNDFTNEYKELTKEYYLKF